MIVSLLNEKKQRRKEENKMQDTRLEEYLTQGVKNIVKGMIRASAGNPKELMYMTRFAATAKRANGHVPPFLIASITSSCNLHCKGCYARANHACHDGETSGQLSVAQWGNIFDQATELNVPFILLAGGEPFTRPDVIRRAAMSKQIVFPIFTNGTLLSKESIALLDQNRNLIPVISIEGNEFNTDDRRGSGVYSIVRNSMRELQRNRILFGASITVTKANISEITSPEFVRGLSESGCKALVFVEYVPSDGKSQNLEPDDNDREYMSARVNELRKEFPRMLMINFPGDEKASGGCLAAGRGFFHINPRGGAEPCPFSPFSDTNLREMTLREALDSPLFTKLRRGGLLTGEHAGGCVLFGKEKQIKEYMGA